jgi:peptidoglycan/LPS O-acetylase OafA/YrhL
MLSDHPRRQEQPAVPDGSRSIPSLDGLRAFSVGLVIFAHSLDRLPGRAGHLIAARLGLVGLAGVNVFFVISGFLITHLLMKEQMRTGTIRLGNFYFRRLLRIFPPFYVYLGVVGVLWAFGASPLTSRGFLSAATYTFNYTPRWSEWLVAHTWSLSLEEQFYLLWPPLLFLLGKRRGTNIAIGVIFLSPVVRVVSHWVTPSLMGLEWSMLHTHLDTIMFGCVVALQWDEIRSYRFVRSLLKPFVFAFSVVFVVVCSPYLSFRFGGRYDWTIGYTLQSLLIALMLIHVVTLSKSPVGRLLNLRLIRHLGVISYSLYLWQQLFTGPRAFAFPLNLLAVLACAELSYWLIERPSFRLRDRLELRLNKRPVFFVHAMAALPNRSSEDEAVEAQQMSES